MTDVFRVAFQVRQNPGLPVERIAELAGLSAARTREVIYASETMEINPGGYVRFKAVSGEDQSNA